MPEQGGKGGLIAAAVVGAVVLFFASGPITRAVRGRAFPEAELRRFAAVGFARGEDSVPEHEMPYRRGKVILVKRGQLDTSGVKEIDPPTIPDAWYDLPSSIRAGTPAEVQTVIVVQTGLTTVGYYVREGPEGANDRKSAGSLAKRPFVNLFVYDMEKKILVGVAELVGGMPGERISATDSRVGAPADIVGCLQKMPTR